MKNITSEMEIIINEFEKGFVNAKGQTQRLKAESPLTTLIWDFYKKGEYLINGQQVELEYIKKSLNSMGSKIELSLI